MRSNTLAALLAGTILVLAGCGDTAAPVPDHMLTVSVSGMGEGSVTSAPAGIDCTSEGGTCTASFPEGTTVTLTAEPAPRSTFTGWNGGAGAATRTVEVTAGVAIDAAFDNPDRAGSEVGAAGATVTSRDGALTLEIPAGALPTAQHITVERFTPDQLGADLADVQAGYGVTAAYRLEPDGLQFAEPVTVRLNVAGGASTSDGTMSLRAPRLILASGNARQTLGVSVEPGPADGSTVLTTQIEHFSWLVETKPFLATVNINGVPHSSRVNVPFFTDVTAVGDEMAAQGSPLQPLSYAQYNRRSHGGIVTLGLQPAVALSRFNATEFWQGGFEYRCIVPGIGTYEAIVEVRYEDAGIAPSDFHFTQEVDCLARPTLTVTKSGDGEGYVGSDVAGIQCGDECVAGFDAIDVVLTAIPSQGSVFVGWTGDCAVNPENSHRAVVDMRQMVDRTCDARFEKMGVIRGRVSTSSGEIGIAGVTVHAGSASAQTDGNGEHLIDLLPPGDYTVTISGVPSGLECAPEAQDVSVTGAAEGVANFNCEAPTGTIIGHVTLDGEPLAGATVQIGDVEVTTDDEGDYRLDGVAPGTYEIRVLGLPEGASCSPASHEVTVEGGDVHTADFSCTATAEPGTIAGVLTAEGNPLGGVQIQVGGQSIFTNADGSFNITALTAGVYTLALLGVPPWAICPTFANLVVEPGQVLVVQLLCSIIAMQLTVDASYRHLGGSSEVCLAFGHPALANLAYVAILSTLNGQFDGSGTHHGVFDANGNAFIRNAIFLYGTYRWLIQFLGREVEVETDVGGAAGACRPG